MTVTCRNGMEYPRHVRGQDDRPPSLCLSRKFTAARQSIATSNNPAEHRPGPGRRPPSFVERGGLEPLRHTLVLASTRLGWGTKIILDNFSLPPVILLARRACSIRTTDCLN